MLNKATVKLSVLVPRLANLNELSRLITSLIPSFEIISYQTLPEGLRQAVGNKVIILDSDWETHQELISTMWNAHQESEIVLVSRFKAPETGQAERILHRILASVLHLALTDFSSGYCLFPRHAICSNNGVVKDILAFEDVVVRAIANGFSVREISIPESTSGSQLNQNPKLELGLAYLKKLYRLWVLRNSVESADYDHRAYDSLIPLQRYWQRQRSKIVKSFLNPDGKILDIGCGSSRIIQSLPDAIALDFGMHKLRFLKATNPFRVCGSTFALPLVDNCIDQVIHSQVIEHIPFDEVIYRELFRVMKPGGNLVIGTPDYGRIWWPLIEFFYANILPNAYAKEHITHYTLPSLTEVLTKNGFRVREYRYICGGELIVKATKVRP